MHKEQQQQTPGPSKTEQTKKNTSNPFNFHILFLKKDGPMTQLPPLPYPQSPNLPGEATALRAVALSALGQDAFGSLQAANQSLKTFKDPVFFFPFLFSAGRNGAGGDTFSGKSPTTANTRW